MLKVLKIELMQHSKQDHKNGKKMCEKIIIMYGDESVMTCEFDSILLSHTYED